MPKEKIFNGAYKELFVWCAIWVLFLIAILIQLTTLESGWLDDGRLGPEDIFTFALALGFLISLMQVIRKARILLR